MATEIYITITSNQSPKESVMLLTYAFMTKDQNKACGKQRTQRPLLSPLMI